MAYVAVLLLAAAAVSADIRQLSLPTNDLIYDPGTRRIYASVPSRAGALGNSVISIDPETGQMGPAVFVGSEPNKLARSDDGQYLYVGLNGASAVRRFDLTSQTAGPQFSLGLPQFIGPLRPGDIEVAPGHPETVAVALGNGGVAVYDNGVPRPKQLSWPAHIRQITYGRSADRLYGSEARFARMAVDPSGVTLIDSLEVGLLGSKIQFAGGRIYGSSGLVIDPDTGQQVGTFNVGFSNTVAPDLAAGRVYFLSGMDHHPTRSLLAFDPRTFLQLASMPVPGVNGPASSLIRWGEREDGSGGGLAFRTDQGQVFLIRPSVATSTGIDLALSGSATPDPVAQDRPLTLSLVVANTSSAPATGVTLIESLPTPLADMVVSITASQGQCRQAGSQIICSLGSLAGGARAEVTVVLRPGASNPAGISAWTGVASVTASEPDPKPDNNRTDLMVHVIPRGSPPSALPPLRQLTLATNDLVYDPVSRKIYASVPGSAPSGGNSITSIDPTTGQLGPSVFVGSEPNKLALSDDGQYLYVGLDGASSVRRFDLDSQTAGLQFSLGQGSFLGPYYVGDMEVMPGNPRTVAISQRSRGVSPSFAGVAIYDDGVPRGKVVPYPTLISSIVFSDLPSRLYGYNMESSEFGFRRMTIDAAGVVVDDVTENLITGYGTQIYYDQGLIFSTAGQVVDPEARRLLGTFTGLGFGAPMVPDVKGGRAYFLTGEGTTRTLLIFDVRTFRLIGSREIPEVRGRVNRLIRWGQGRADGGGLAFGTSERQVFLITLEHLNTPPLDFSLSLSPDRASGEGVVTLTVTLTAPAPVGGVRMELLSSRPAAAAVPPTLLVPVGARSASTSVAVHAVPVPLDVVLTASMASVTHTATLRLTPMAQPTPTTGAQLTLFPNPVLGGMPALGQLILARPAGAGGVTVPLTSDYPHLIALPATVTVPPGASAVTFTIGTQSVRQSFPATVTAGTGAGAVKATLVLVPVTAPVPVTPTAPPLNLLVNGSFEEPSVPAGQPGRSLSGAGDLPGWRLLRGSVTVLSALPAVRQPAPDGGRQSLVLSGEDGMGTIEQSFATEPGRDYLFSGWISHTPGTTEGLAWIYVNSRAYGQFSHAERYFGATTPADMRWVRFVAPIRATGTTTTLTLSGLTPGDGAVFDGLAVTPVDPQNASVTPAPPTGPPAAPTGLAATQVGADRVTLTWKDNSSDEAVFVVYRQEAGKEWVKLADAPRNSTSYTDQGLRPGTTYR